jgi:hypothetical protein
MMQRLELALYYTALVACGIVMLLILVLGFGTPRAHAEEATIADGLTKSDWLQAGVNNNVEYSTALTNTFTTNGTTTVTVAHPSHGKSVTNKFTIESGPTIDGLDMNGAWTIASVPNSNSYTFTHTGTASGSTATTGTAVSTFGAAADDGKLRFLCLMSHANYDDPIKFPGTPGAAHLHHYFGNRSANYASTYPLLRASGDGTCDGGPLNRTAYWFPALLTQSGTKMLYPQDAQWYYVNNQRRNLIEYTSPACPSGSLACPQLPVRRLQRGQKAIFGFDPSTGAFPAVYASATMLDSLWTCQDTSGNQQGGAYRYLHHRSNASLGLSSNVSCPSAGKVVARADAPSCWNGELDHADHYSHFTQPSQDGYSNLVCPATHPYSHATFTIILTWNYTGGFSQIQNWWLSSDRHHADYEAGQSFHWDMLFAWNDAVMDFWASNIWGASSDPNDPATYVYRTAGGGGNGAAAWVGGKHMRNTNSGGLGVVSITPCDSLGISGSCSLKDRTTLGLTTPSDTEVDIPSATGTTKTLGGKAAVGGKGAM